MKTKNSLKLFIFLIVYVFCIFNCSITFAANEGLKIGTYISGDGEHTITVGGDGTILYDGTTSLTETADERGNVIKGSSGTFYQLNNSKLVNGTDYTVFSLNTEPVIDENGGIEVWSNGSKVNTYVDFQSAVDAAKTGDTIKITKDLDVVGGAYVSGKNLTIDGGSHTLNSATWSNSVFIVEEDATLNVKDLTIDGGATGFEVDRDAASWTTIPLKANSDAHDPKQNLSAIITKGDLIADKLNMNNNYTGGNGAAVRVVTGNITLNNSKFSHNRASTGGAIYIGSNFKENQTTYPVQNVVLENTNITSNYSSHAGGMYIYNTNKVSIKNSNFLNNSVTGGKGGGVLFASQSSTDKNYHCMGKQLGLEHIQAEIDNCTFDGNWVGNDGFAIENQEAEMLITNSTFKNNVGTEKTKNSIGTISNIGDECEYYDVTIKNCILEKNKGNCAGIGDHGSKLNLVVEDTKFIENESQYTILMYSGDASFKNCEFVKETATQGVIIISIYSKPNNTSWHKPTIIVDDCTFTDTTIDSADILLRKYSRNIGCNSATLYLEGNTNGNIHIWDDNRIVVNGNHTGDIYKDILTSADEGIKISENATVNGNVDYNNDQYTYKLVFNDIKDGFENMFYLYLDKDRTYTQKEFFMKHFISEDGYMLKYYTDSSYTTEWDYTASITTNKANIYGKWVEHTHTYDGTTVLYENALYDQCICGYLGNSLTLSASSDLVENDKEKPIVVNDEIGINSADYQITYQVIKDGKWKEYSGVPVNEGTYKAILTYNNMSIEQVYTITERIAKPEDTNTPQKPEGDSNTPQNTPGDSTDTTGKTEDNADKTKNQDNNIENPVTSDNIILFVITSILSLGAIILLVIRFKKITK